MMFEGKDKEEARQKIKADRSMLDLMEKMVEGWGSDTCEKTDENTEERENCGMVHGKHSSSTTTDREKSKILEQVEEVLTGSGGMLSIIGTLKCRKDGDSIGVFFSRRMRAGEIVNGLLDLVMQAYGQVTENLSEEKRKELKKLVVEALEKNL